MMRSQTVSTMTLTVADAEQATAFYVRAFGCIVLFDHIFEAGSYSQLGECAPSSVRVVTMRLGDEYIELQQYLDLDAAPIPEDSRSHDLWFQHAAIVVRDMDLAYQHLKGFEFEPISVGGPKTIPLSNPDAGGVRAFKFRDMDRHSLELIWFPPDKCDSKWENPGERLFLGIDHSAIAVSNTEQSLSFYRDLLGLEVAGHGNNKGETQAALDNLPAADIKLTTLESAKINIELLDYQQPEDSRTRPQDWQIKDLPHRHLILEVEGLRSILKTLQSHFTSGAAPRIVSLPKDYRYAEGILIKDPDGHSILLVAAS